jgi:hypothetical protein
VDQYLLLAAVANEPLAPQGFIIRRLWLAVLAMAAVLMHEVAAF